MVEPKKFGRGLGIGVRVASNLLRERARQVIDEGGGSRVSLEAAGLARGKTPTSTETSRPTSRPETGQSKSCAFPAATRATTQATRGIAYGARRFGQAVWGPLTHAGSILWLEVTGVFFALFALFFAQNLYRVRGAWKYGPEHSHFLLYCAMTLIFFWFSSSSFLRAYRKNKRSHR